MNQSGVYHTPMSQRISLSLSDLATSTNSASKPTPSKTAIPVHRAASPVHIRAANSNQFQPAPTAVFNRSPHTIGTTPHSTQPPAASSAASASTSTPASVDYKRELSKLLSKSRGTPYESTLRRFVEKKLKDITKDSEEQEKRLNILSSPPPVPPSSVTGSVARSASPPSRYYSVNSGPASSANSVAGGAVTGSIYSAGHSQIPYDAQSDLASLRSTHTNSFSMLNLDKVHSEQQQAASSAASTRVSLASLSTSKYDKPVQESHSSGVIFVSPRRSTSQSRAGSASKSRTSQSQSQIGERAIIAEEETEDWLNQMSTPLNRHRYKGPEKDVHRISTNHVGRQRPPPKDYSSPIASAFRTSQSPSHSRRLPQSPQPPSPPKGVVSSEEFEDWLVQNKAWKEKKNMKVQAAREKVCKTLQTSTTPKIFSKSIKLADIAYTKELSRLKEKSEKLHLEEVNDLLSAIEVSIDDAQASLKSPHPGSSSADRSGRDRQQRFSSPSAASVQSGRSMSASRLDVYDRLAIRGRVYAEEYKTYKPPDVQREFFSPSIHERSLKLAEQKRSKERSKQQSIYSTVYNPYSQNQALFKRAQSLQQNDEDDEDDKENQSEAASVPAYTSDTFISRMQHQDGQQRRRARSLSANGRRDVEEHDSQQLDHNTPRRPVSTQNLVQSVRYDLDRYRSASVTRLEQEKKKRVQREFYDEEAIKPFQPTLVAKETARIMARKKSSFEERNVKAVENTMLRKVVASRAPSPGPGHYYGTSVVGSLRAASSPTVVTARMASTLGSECTHFTGSKSSPSPGYRGFSFGKGKLVKSINTEDDLQTIYEFKAPMNSSLNNTMRMSSLQSSPEAPNSGKKDSLLSTTSSSKYSYQPGNSGGRIEI